MKNCIWRHAAMCFGALALTASCSSGDGEKQAGNTPEVYHNVFVAQPQSQGASLSKDYAAVVQESRTIATGFKTGGQIERVYAREGDHVAQGQLLAELDNADYKLAVEELTVLYNQLSAQMKRMEKLHAAKNLSENEYEQAVAQLEQTRVKLEKERNKLAYTRLYAPSSGVIVKRNHEKGESVQAGTGVFELMDDGTLEVVVDIPVGEFVNRDNFRSFTGHSSLDPSDRFPLSLVSLTPKADNNQLYQLKLGVPAASRRKLTSGMNLTVTIDQKEGTDHPGFAVPARAVFGEKGQSFVWSVNPDSTVTRRSVTTSGELLPGDKVMVTSGLDGTERVVRAGVHSLTEGEKVAILSENPSTNVGNLL